MSGIDASATDSLFALYRAGDFGKLAERAGALLETHPRELVLHTLLGAAFLELGDYEKAIASYRAALAIHPGFAKAHNSLGIVFLRCGRLQEATDSFRSAIEHDPRFAEARFNLGIVYENGQRPRDAAAQYERAVELDPGYAKAWSALATACWELGRYGAVAGHYRRALAADGSHLPAHRGLMQFLEQSNRREELRNALAQARESLGADHPLVRTQEGVIAAWEGDNPTARALLEGCAFDTGDAAGLHDERMRLSHLAGICDRMDDTGPAMRYAAEANRLSGQLSSRRGIDKAMFLEFVENRRRYFQGDNIRQWRLEPEQSKGAGADNKSGSPAEAAANKARPVFVIGFPRSGTTLIDTMLRGHPRIDVAEESDAVPAMVNRLSGASDAGLTALGTLSPGAIESASAEYFERLNRHVPSTSADAAITVIDRFALNIVYAGEILRVFPDARFILMLRHPADCVLSCYLRTFTETSANASFHTLEEAAFLYDQVFGLWQQYADLLEPDAIEVRYENLVNEVERTCRSVLAFVGLPWHAGVLDHERTARNRPYIRTASYDQVIEPVHSGASGRWLRYREFLEPVLPTLEPWIERFGYKG